jgi:membrane-associated phospholipid phosphatase
VAPFRWEWIAVGYYAYLTFVSFVDRRFVRARARGIVATAICCAVLGAQAFTGNAFGLNPIAFALLVPLPVLLGGYWLSGLFFVRPNPRLEQWLMAVDDRLVRRPGILATYQSRPRIMREVAEFAYLLVYLVIPAGVTALTLGGRSDAVPRFWGVVLLAAFISYGMLPWLQTRPPRAIETGPHPDATLRRFNGAILNRGSIQVNTIPSGHAASAVATALAVSDAMPLAGVIFLLLAAAIVAATVLGRYHYLVDSLLGVVVAVAAWLVYR